MFDPLIHWLKPLGEQIYPPPTFVDLTTSFQPVTNTLTIYVRVLWLSTEERTSSGPDEPLPPEENFQFKYTMTYRMWSDLRHIEVAEQIRKHIVSQANQAYANHEVLES